MAIPDQAPADLSLGLADSGYLRERRNPKPGDLFYLHLRDVLDALSAHATEERLKVLDFGSGGSPYRYLFPNAEYLRADLEGEGLDFTINADGQLAGGKAASFDLILSTQVLEHVANPALYFSECRRLLRPGGKLLLTTHGIYEDHLCPNDYFRWTAQGLRLILTNAGFQVRAVQKLTTSGRSLCFTLQRHLFLGGASPPASYALFCRVLNRVLRPLMPMLHRLADWCFRDCRAVSDSESGHPLYVALLVEASH